MDIQLTFVNLSNDVNNRDIMFFQKNVPMQFNELAVARTSGSKSHEAYQFYVNENDSAANAEEQGLYTISTKGGEYFKMRPVRSEGLKFAPILYVCVVPLNESRPLDVKKLLSISTILNLTGVGKGEIYMTGGGSGASAQPHEFSLRHS